MKWLSYLMMSIIIVFLGCLVYVNVTDYTIYEKYNYCVEWEGNLGRDEMVWRCYNFRENKILCDWEVTTDQNLIIYDAYEPEKVLSMNRCMKWTKVKEVCSDCVFNKSELPEEIITVPTDVEILSNDNE